ncbi:c-type cytochrome biogenesis protein CcmI [Microbulbifer sp. OS29]|uniref:C-type cytochrome biogenesis protein CcmI n=1 Tax=Microbulbifer okhotskensis TaxID=2926617 RepID=A0A9X2J5R2_9GAMM|nr:c-type cytochrome biogenesis protein CcmI [Microbulbifer okhotskensis]MCO1335817.1 c-type cytochrome biogenesis protein CcmI [Microbulbifer okhotskensis]
MIDIWFGVALLLLLVSFVLLVPAIRAAGVRRNDDSKRLATAALYRERSKELRAAVQSGAMDETQFAQLEADLARELLAAQQEGVSTATKQGGRNLFIGVAVLVPAIAVAAYAFSGRPAEVALYRDMVASQSGQTSFEEEARITDQLQERAKTHPDDLSSRYVLAQRLLVSGDLAGAVESYRYVVNREPQAANVKAELAQALFFGGGSKITDEIRLLVSEAIQVQPTNGTALGLAGIAAFEDGDFRMARQHWRAALTQLSPGSPAAEALHAGVIRAEKALAENGEAVVVSSKASSDVAGPAIRVTVSLAEGVNTAASTPVFVYARSAASPMPLAIVRLTAGQLPTEVILDESRAMMPSASIASVDSVQLVARLAVKGDARPAPGDWQGMISTLPKARWGEAQSVTIDSKL